MTQRKELITSSKKRSLEKIFSENIENIMKITNYIICHSQTKLNFKMFQYTWNIADFLNVFRSLSSLITCGREKLPFDIIVYFDKDNNELRFCSWFNFDKKKINVNYYIEIITIEEPKETEIILNICKQNIYLSHNEFLFRVSVEDLRAQESTYLPNGTLTIFFQFEVLESISHNFISENIITDSQMSRIDTLVSNLYWFLNKKSDSLVKFVIDKKYLYIDKVLLCSKSNVFEAMFKSGLTESKSNEIEISDIKFNVFEHLLFYVENGSLANHKLDSTVNNSETLCDLIVAANKYNIKDLILSCEKLLILNTSKDNVIEHLRVAHLNNAKFLEKYAIKFIKLYENNIVETSSFITLIQMYPNLLTNIKEEKLHNLQITEIIV